MSADACAAAPGSLRAKRSSSPRGVQRFEVRAIYAFYSSDVGRKYLLAQHELSDSTQARIAALLAPHRADLDAATQALITKAVSP